MKKPNFDVKKRPYTNNKFVNNRPKPIPVVETFSVDKLEQFSDEMIELFKLIQAVRYDRIRLQEEYNESRLKLSNDRMNLESEVIKLKKQYNAKISSLQEEYNSVKSNNSIELAKVREG
ncbi:hypothetical protein LO80_08050 [Candidatus Francisella endociliophora]|uniref:Uncharacterized protein n=1 Tax=Candidatus Francisella endociliophora TaxID=653937 RepID=A0A097EQT1_9GAMM|nr:hypothetical protein [Francisella sp. FSC1006]AIT09923.1 hypothetical protein LO80_08050 [Francisella sp. FSC1006]